jgi:hypothetical protein
VVSGSDSAAALEETDIMTTSIKANARTVAAPVVNAAITKANLQIKELATRYTTQVEGAVGKAQLDTAIKARLIVERVPDADITPLISAFGRKRKSEICAIIGATDSELTIAGGLFQKNRKPGLQQMARAISLIRFGAIVDDVAAQRYLSSGKKADYLLATGQESEPVVPVAVADEGDDDDDATESRTVAHNTPASDTVGNLSRLTALMPALEKELGAYGPECKKAMVAFKRAADALVKAAANG